MSDYCRMRAVGSSSCANSSLGTERRPGLASRRWRGRALPPAGGGTWCHSRLRTAPLESWTGRLGSETGSLLLLLLKKARRRRRMFAPLRVRGSIPLRARRGPVCARVFRKSVFFSAPAPTHCDSRKKTHTQQVMAHGTPASATTVVAPFKPLSQNVNAIQAAYHPNPTVQKFLGVIFWRIHRPGRPTRAGKVRRHFWNRRV